MGSFNPCCIGSGIATLQSLGSNTDHGKRRSNADKRRAVEMMLKDAEWVKWGDREISRQCAVDNKFVGNVRRDVSVDYPQIEKTATRNGTTYTINTGNIGRNGSGGGSWIAIYA